MGFISDVFRFKYFVEILGHIVSELVRLLSFYGDDGDGGDDDIDITQLSGWGIPERPSPSSPSSLGALEGSKHGQGVATGQPAEKPTGTAPNPCEATGA